MDLRRESRFQADQKIRVTLLKPPRTGMEGQICNASGRGIGVAVPQQLKPGEAIQIDVDDSFLLGEVIYCRMDGDRWYAGIELEHALFGLAELAATLSEFTDGRSGTQHAYALHDACGENTKQSR